MFLLAWLQTLILLLSGKFPFGAPWNKGYPETVVIVTVYIFAMTGLGLFLAGILKTQGQVQAVAMAVALVGTMLGNVFFPIDNGSRVIRLVARISPQNRAAHALKEVLMNGASLSSLGVPLLWMGHRSGLSGYRNPFYKVSGITPALLVGVLTPTGAV